MTLGEGGGYTSHMTKTLALIENFDRWYDTSVTVLMTRIALPMGGVFLLVFTAVGVAVPEILR